MRKAPLLIILGGVFLFIDRYFKLAALGKWSTPVEFGKYLAWEPFLNEGVAFGIYLPPYLIFAFTIGIIFSVCYLFYLHLKESPAPNYKKWSMVGLTLVITGAVSNLLDRIVYGVTVDYLRIAISVINLADVLIVSGFVLYFSSLKHLK